MNLFDPGTPTPEEAVTILSETDTMRIERIVSWHHTTPKNDWYDQDEDEWVTLLEGTATLTYEDGTAVPLAKGDTLFLPAHVRHQVTATSAPAIWLCVFAKVLRKEPHQ